MSQNDLNSLPANNLTPEIDPTAAVPDARPLRYRPLALHELLCTAASKTDWLWEGYVAPGNITLLISYSKCGKTTLLSVLLDRMRRGGELAGRRVRAGRAVVVSEEDESHWGGRARKLDFGAVGWLCRPFRGRPRPAEWLELIDDLGTLRDAGQLDLVVIDPLATFLPGRAENDAGTMLDCLLPLQRLTERGVAVLVLHHPKKAAAPPGQAARGSGALTGCVDILIEMGYAAGPADDDRRRRLLAFSRHPATPRRLVIELNAEGTDYITHGDFRDQDDRHGWELLKMVLEDASRKLQRREILAEWPADLAKPDESTLWRWMEQALAANLICREGTGRKNDPNRYWLPGQEDLWALDPFRLADMPELEDGMTIARRELAKKQAKRRGKGAGTR